MERIFHCTLDQSRVPNLIITKPRVTGDCDRSPGVHFHSTPSTPTHHLRRSVSPNFRFVQRSRASCDLHRLPLLQMRTIDVPVAVAARLETREKVRSGEEPRRGDNTRALSPPIACGLCVRALTHLTVPNDVVREKTTPIHRSITPTI